MEDDGENATLLGFLGPLGMGDGEGICMDTISEPFGVPERRHPY
jgi:hypothetical protein